MRGYTYMLCGEARDFLTATRTMFLLTIRLYYDISDKYIITSTFLSMNLPLLLYEAY